MFPPVLLLVSALAVPASGSTDPEGTSPPSLLEDEAVPEAPTADPAPSAGIPWSVAIAGGVTAGIAVVPPLVVATLAYGYAAAVLAQGPQPGVGVLLMPALASASYAVATLALGLLALVSSAAAALVTVVAAHLSDHDLVGAARGTLPGLLLGASLGVGALSSPVAWAVIAYGWAVNTGNPATAATLHWMMFGSLSVVVGVGAALSLAAAPLVVLGATLGARVDDEASAEEE